MRPKSRQKHEKLEKYNFGGDGCFYLDCCDDFTVCMYVYVSQLTEQYICTYMQLILCQLHFHKAAKYFILLTRVVTNINNLLLN